jgi:NAD(P)-dependent dehydrogenase (short-subunit alcohol dehydrogenase family)
MTRGIAVVTGGSAGLGRAISRELAKRGWDVAILARGDEGLAATVSEVEALGHRAFAVSVDVVDRVALGAAADRIEAEFGAIDLWVNNAMAGVFGEFLSTDPDDFERATAVNYFGFVNGTRAALSRMVPRDSGQVIQVGSALAHRGIPLQAAYCGAKHAITGFTESVTTELLHNHSRVRVSQVDMPALNTIQFNWVKSRLPNHPMPVAPIFQPEVGARAVADVAERPRSRTWVGESTVATILGNRFGARLLDRLLAKSAYDGQQDASKTEAMLPSNLYAPVAGDHGAHGIFDGEARTSSPAVWAIENRPLATGLAAIAGVAAASLVVGLLRRR